MCYNHKTKYTDWCPIPNDGGWGICLRMWKPVKEVALKILNNGRMYIWRFVITQFFSCGPWRPRYNRVTMYRHRADKSIIGSMFSFFRINTYTKLHKIGTLQYSSHIYCQFQTVFSAQIIIHVLYLMAQLKIYSKRKIASKMQNVFYKNIEIRWRRETLAEIYSACQGGSLRRRLVSVAKRRSDMSWF